MTKPLSPAAQAVLDAYNEDRPVGDSLPRNALVEALRAAADQVAPSDADEPRNYLPMAIECQRIRFELLTIVDELEAS
jgi:hypothetical protein